MSLSVPTPRFAAARRLWAAATHPTRSWWTAASYAASHWEAGWLGAQRQPRRRSRATERGVARMGAALGVSAKREPPS